MQRYEDVKYIKICRNIDSKFYLPIRSFYISQTSFLLNMKNMSPHTYCMEKPSFSSALMYDRCRHDLLFVNFIALFDVG